MIFRGYYISIAEICTIPALNQVANKYHPLHAWHEHVNLQLSIDSKECMLSMYTVCMIVMDSGDREYTPTKKIHLSTIVASYQHYDIQHTHAASTDI